MSKLDGDKVQAMVRRSQEQDAANRRLQQIISQMDQYVVATRNLHRPLAEALAVLAGQPIAITGMQPDPESGMLGAIHYATPDGGQHTLTIDRAPSKPASQIGLPN